MNELKQDSSLFDELKSFILHIKSSKRLKIALVFNLVYFLFTSIYYLILLNLDIVNSTIFADDFGVFYKSYQIVLDDPIQLYNNDLYELPFRYLPMYSYMHVFFGFMNLPSAYLLNNLFMYLIHHASMFLIYIISIKFYNLDTNRENFEKGYFLAFLIPLQVPNYILGQNANYFVFLLLISLFFFENSIRKIYSIRLNNLIGGFFLGIAITIKPIAILFIPFILPFRILLNFKNSNKIQISVEVKDLLSRITGISAALLPNLIIFAVFPSLLSDFISINFSHATLDYHQSTSLTHFLIYIFNLFDVDYSRSFLILSITTIFIIPVFIYYISIDKNNPRKMNYSLYYGYAMLIMLISYPDSWFLYAYIWYMVQLPGFLKLLEKVYNNKGENENVTTMDKKLAYINIKISIYSIVYFAIGVILHYLILGFDPISPVAFIIFYFIYGHFILKFF